MRIAYIAGESLDKGKPSERAGRKAVGLNLLIIQKGDMVARLPGGLAPPKC
jgi:hypothetical protein